MTQKKTLTFWIGLIITVLSLLVFFQILWMTVMYNIYNRWRFFKGVIPLVFGTIIFALIDIWMMMSERGSAKELPAE